MPPNHRDKQSDLSVGVNPSSNDKDASFASMQLINYDYDDSSEDRRDLRARRHFSPYFALCLSTFSLAFCCFLVHGAVARQPTHLLPYFFLQVFDFIISLLTVIGYMSSTSGVRMWVHTKQGAIHVNSMSLVFLMLSISCMMLAFKAYCLGMVWDCYKYLMLTAHSSDRGNLTWSDGRFGFLPTFWSFLGTGRRRSSLFRSASQRTFETNSDHSRGPPATYEQTNDLPNYEDALKIPANAYAPPPYFCPTTTTKTDSTGTTTEANQRPPSTNVTTQGTNVTSSDSNPSA